MIIYDLIVGFSLGIILIVLLIVKLHIKYKVKGWMIFYVIRWERIL